MLRYHINKMLVQFGYVAAKFIILYVHSVIWNYFYSIYMQYIYIYNEEQVPVSYGSIGGTWSVIPVV